MQELNHTGGKGDKERSPGWRKRYDEIDFHRGEKSSGFARRGNKLVKVYAPGRVAIFKVDLAGPAESPSARQIGSEVCAHIIAYADERDANPCPVCEVQRLREAMRHAEFWCHPPTGVGWTTCRGCGCIYSPKSELQIIEVTAHKPNCPFRFWLDEDGRVVMTPNRDSTTPID
jgi:hypothetical protein